MYENNQLSSIKMKNGNQSDSRNVSNIDNNFVPIKQRQRNVQTKHNTAGARTMGDTFGLLTDSASTSGDCSRGKNLRVVTKMKNSDYGKELSSNDHTGGFMPSSANIGGFVLDHRQLVDQNHSSTPKSAAAPTPMDPPVRH